MTLGDIEAALEQVKTELGVHSIYADAQGRYYLSAVERVVGIAIDHLSVAKAHEETRKEVAF